MSVSLGAIVAAIIAFLGYTVAVIFGARKFERQKIRNTIAEEQIKNRDEINKRITEYETRKADIKKRFDHNPADCTHELALLSLEYSDVTGSN